MEKERQRGSEKCGTFQEHAIDLWIGHLGDLLTMLRLRQVALKFVRYVKAENSICKNNAVWLLTWLPIYYSIVRGVQQ